MPSAHSLLLLQSAAANGAFNMALDEALLESASTFDAPILRFYAWTEPAASFGYFQHYSDVAHLTQLRPLVRRPTGGGVVPHDRDWTYSVVFSPAQPWYALSAIESYRQMHEWIQRAFARLQVPTELATISRKAQPGECFVGHEKFDLLWHGQKIAGAAQRRTKHALLIQGSIQPPPISLNRKDWETAMLESLPSGAATGWQNLLLQPSLADRAHHLARTKYSQSSYNQKR